MSMGGASFRYADVNPSLFSSVNAEHCEARAAETGGEGGGGL